MSITAKEVNELRMKTGAGMMDCKKALTEANGDFEAAIDLLRKKGQKVSASRSDRDAKEGAIFARTNSNSSKAVLIELNCETDFVAKNSDFLRLGEMILQVAEGNAAVDVESLKQQQLDGRPLQDVLTDYMGKIGEKIDIRNFRRIEAEKVIAYIHPGSRLGVLVGFKNTSGVNMDQLGKDVAMQIAAMNPIAVDKEGVNPSLIEKEIEIGKEQARAEGKPEAMLEKIAMGKLNKFYKESTLLNQDFVKDASRTIGQYLKEQKPDLQVTGFVRVQLGTN